MIAVSFSKPKYFDKPEFWEDLWGRPSACGGPSGRLTHDTTIGGLKSRRRSETCPTSAIQH